MPLPQRCPLDNAEGCRKKDCYLYHVDWRTGEENCSIGYRYTHRTGKKSRPVKDTYALNVKLRREQHSVKKPEIAEEKSAPAEKVSEEKTDIQEKYIADPIVPGKEIIISPDTESPEEEAETRIFSDESQKKKTKIDDIMKMDLPEDYEEEFWSDGWKKN